MVLLAQRFKKIKGLSRDMNFIIKTLKDSFLLSKKLSFKDCPLYRLYVLGLD